MNIACSTATSLSPLIGKVTFYCTFVSRESRKVLKVKNVRKTVFWSTSLKLINGGLEDLSAHNL